MQATSKTNQAVAWQMLWKILLQPAKVDGQEKANTSGKPLLSSGAGRGAA